MIAPEFSIRDLAVSAGGRPILAGLDLDIAPCSMLGIVGPSGGGKSTLLSAIAGQPGPGIALTSLTAQYRGRTLGEGAMPLLIRQKIRERCDGPGGSRALAQARLLEIARMVAVSEDLLCIDEPTAGLDPEDGLRIMTALRRRSARATVVVVSHNAREVAASCTEVALLAGGRIVERCSAERFFAVGASPAAQHFTRTGGLALPCPGTPETHLPPELRAVPTGYNFDADQATERHPVWIIDNRLCLDLRPGLPEGPAPNGVLVALEDDGVRISRPGSASERVAWPAASRPPDGSSQPPIAICRLIDTFLSEGRTVAIQPRGHFAGAGALLGILLILRGFPPDAAFRLAERKLPMVLLGLRLEELLWEVDLELSMAGAEPAH